MNLAKACSKNGIFERFDYISTAYVAGNSRGIFDENSLDKGQGFSNSYERSKFEAELLLASFRPSFPLPFIDHLLLLDILTMAIPRILRFYIAR